VKSIFDAGPIEFLSLISGASIIFTDSFHGTVFSILFRKPFYSFVDTDVSRRAMNSRIHSLTKMLGLDHRIYEAGKICNDMAIDYKAVDSIVQIERKKSIDFLKRSLSSNL